MAVEPTAGSATAPEAAAPAGREVVTPHSFEEALARELGDLDAPAPESAEETQTEPDPDTDAEAPADDSGDEPQTDEETEPTDEEGDEESEDEEDKDDAEDQDDDAPADYHKLPKWAKQRLSKQSAQLRELKKLAREVVQVTPSPLSPLASVEDEAALEQQVTLAKQIREWVRKNPYGGTIQGAEGPIEITQEDAEAKLAYAESVLDAAPDAKQRLMVRAQAKPWEQAEAICPNLFKKGSDENKFLTEALTRCPELKSRLHNWEMFVAAAISRIQQLDEEKAGKAKWVRMEIKDGKPVAPKAAPAATRPNAKPANGPRPAAAPAANKAPLKKSDGKPDLEALKERALKSQDPADLRALMLAELGDAA